MKVCGNNTPRNPPEEPSKLLFVNRGNIARVVAAIAPDLVLVNRASFTHVASEMLEIVENAAGG